MWQLLLKFCWGAVLLLALEIFLLSPFSLGQKYFHFVVIFLIVEHLLKFLNSTFLRDFSFSRFLVCFSLNWDKKF